MKRRIIFLIAATVIIILALSFDSNSTKQSNITVPSTENSGEIYLYGEVHGVDKILDKEFELWFEYYNQGMRHLFVELPYYTAELLNIWMQSDSNEILDMIYNDWNGTASHDPNIKEFYER